LIGFLIFSKSRIIQCFGYSIASIIVVFYITSFHYEIAFGTLPGSDLFYYVKELPILVPSLKSNAPIGFVFLEMLYGAALIVAGKYIVGRIGKRYAAIKQNHVFNSGTIILALFIPALLHLSPGSVAYDKFYQGSRNPNLYFEIRSSVALNSLKG